MKIMRTPLIALTLAAAAACNDAQIASSNLSRAADNFEIMRRVVFLNGITDTYLRIDLLDDRPDHSVEQIVRDRHRGSTPGAQRAAPAATTASRVAALPAVRPPFAPPKLKMR